MAVYPYEKTDPAFLAVIDDSTVLDSAFFKKYADTILRIENELGIKPSGTYSDVRTRLDAMELGDRGDGYAAASPNSVAIATHFRHNWVSPIITTPGGPVLLPTIIGKVSMDPSVEAGYDDGYGIAYFVSSFYVDSDVSFTFQLWETTGAPTMLSSNIYTTGEHTVETIIALPISVSLSRKYELRCYQVAAGGPATNTNSIIWNSRFLFVPA